MPPPRPPRRALSPAGCPGRGRPRERPPGGRRSQRAPAGQQDMAARLATPTGRAHYRQRSALVEPGFAQIFQRFGRHLNYRGHNAVDAEIKLLGTVHNLNKLIKHTPKNRS
ncbi:transposase [Streptomyces sp. NPDC058469]|uniref:transposase n=1 Tax=Streptomyces sp. NPDC058469 TaxID=3346514 RepID=UPI0036478C27